MNFGAYDHLLFDRKPDGVLLITINRPEVLNATHERLHRELADVWRDVAADDETRVAVITGAGKAFSSGGDLAMIERQTKNFPAVRTALKEASDIVYNIVNCEKPVVSAINGVAVGAGLAVALMADISIISEDARFTDGHLRLGVGAGDHAAIIWPLLCGMAKAKYYLMTADFIDGREAERIGLVSRCVPAEQLLPTALEVATKLGRGPQTAVRWTKRALNHWILQAAPTFEASLALEMLNFFDDDVVEGTAAIRERRDPSFPSATP
ncbi:MAG: enoyl-CoA hydratase/isomerase family protein [Streptosporangiales bacterium]|nr:enoyl-CoA hydratase/isomerase family protein [Streptosporangiales bacterium]